MTRSRVRADATPDVTMRLRKENGATSVEYAVFVALIAAVLFASVMFLGRNTRNEFECAEIAVAGDVCDETQTTTCFASNGKPKKCKKN